jgi:hypothetical protein
MVMASAMLPLGTVAPPFALRDVVSGQMYSLDSFTGKTGLLIMFICRHCPYGYISNRNSPGSDRTTVIAHWA